jgi:hypothetical protein
MQMHLSDLPEKVIPNQSEQIIHLHIPQIKYFLSQIWAWMEGMDASENTKCSCSEKIHNH